VGSTSNLLEQKFTTSQRSMAFKEMGIRHNSMQNHLLEAQYNRSLSPSKLNISNLKPISEQQPNQPTSHPHDDDLNSSRNSLMNAEFDQALKKMNRVKDNYSTHKKFMDIVKSKSMKALNRKASNPNLSSPSYNNNHSFNSSFNSTDKGELFPLNVPQESRGSVPPDARLGYMTSPRAKSMSKEPRLARADSQASQKSNYSVFNSLSRRIAKFRSSSTQPRNTDDSVDEPDYSNSTSDLNYSSRAQHEQSASQSQVSLEQRGGDKSQDSGVMSPKKLLKGLRARSPFAKKQTSSSDVSKKGSQPSLTVSGGKIRSFTVGSSVDHADETSKSKY
jgi:hypothetical protein